MLWQPFGRVGVPGCSVCSKSQDISLGVAPGLSLQGGHLLSATAKLDANGGSWCQGLAWLSTKSSARLSECRSGGVSPKSSPGRSAQLSTGSAQGQGGFGTELALAFTTFARPSHLGARGPLALNQHGTRPGRVRPWGGEATPGVGTVPPVLGHPVCLLFQGQCHRRFGERNQASLSGSRLSSASYSIQSP